MCSNQQTRKKQRLDSAHKMCDKECREPGLSSMSETHQQAESEDNKDKDRDSEWEDEKEEGTDSESEDAKD